VGRVATYIDWLRTLFDSKRYPWFGDEFIHPREIAVDAVTTTVAGFMPILKRPGMAKAG
jgi:hypothetical protein